MEAVILIGAQASGKSTFYRERFFRTHVRVSLDLLRTRHRERRMLETCIETGQPFVIDNTNPQRTDREAYIAQARSAGFKVVGYYLQSRLAEIIERNAARSEEERIPEKGVRGTYSRLELPSLDEGFDELYYVRYTEPEGYIIERWKDEV